MAAITRWYRTYRGEGSVEEGKLADTLMRDRKTIRIPFVQFQGDRVRCLDVKLSHEEAHKLHKMLGETLAVVDAWKREPDAST